MASGMQLFSLMGQVVLDDGGINDKLKGIVGQAESTSSGFDSAFGKIKSAALGLATALGVGFGLKEIYDEATESNQAMSQMNAVLKSTHDVSGMTKDSLEELAESQSKVTTYSKTQTESAENLMLTFTKIGKDVFPGAIQASQDMATAMHMDLNSATLQVGKALGNLSLNSKGTVQGLSMLQREGVNFSDAEKGQIAVLLKHNNVAGAQKIVLQELSTEFGGSAASSADTFSGKLTILKNNLLDVGAGIMEKLFPPIENLVSSINNHMPQIQKAITDVINTVKPFIQPIIQDITTIAKNLLPSLGGSAQNAGGQILGLVKGGLSAVKDVLDWMAQHGAIIKGVAEGILAVFIGYKVISGIISGISTAMKIWQGITKAFTVVQAALNLVLSMSPLGIIVLAIGALVAAFIILWNTCKPFRDFWINLFGGIRDITESVVNAVIEFFQNLGKGIGDVFNGIKSFFVGIFDWIQGFFGKWGTVILAILVPFLGIPLLIFQHFGQIKEWLESIWNDVIGGIRGFVDAAGGIIGNIGNVIVHGFDSAISFIKNLPGQMLGWGKDMIDGLVNGIKNGIGAITGAVSDVANTIKSFLHFSVPDTGPLVDADTYGGDFIDLIQSGMEKNLGNLKNTVSNVAGTIVDGLNGNVNLNAQVAYAGNAGIATQNQNKAPVQQGNTFHFASGAITIQAQDHNDIANWFRGLSNQFCLQSSTYR